MIDYINLLREWILNMGGQYGVNPLIFGGIYVGAIPFFSVSIGWLVRNYRRKKSIIWPGICSIFFFISSYLYLIIDGEGVPWWIYILMCGMILAGVFTAIRKIRRQIKNEKHELRL